MSTRDVRITVDGVVTVVTFLITYQQEHRYAHAATVTFTEFSLSRLVNRTIALLRDFPQHQSKVSPGER